MKRFPFALLLVSAVACSVDATPENGVQGCGPIEDPCATGFYCATDHQCWQRGTGPGTGMDNTDADMIVNLDGNSQPGTGDGGLAGTPDGRSADPDATSLPADECTGSEAAMIGDPCTVGIGACARTGIYQCMAGIRAASVACSVAAGAQAIEVCNGTDDDCDSVTDNGLLPIDCALTMGVCTGSKQKCGGAGGWTACGQGTYGPDYQTDESLCDGKDNDCDGQTDEAFPSVNTLCTAGVGECARNGTYMCNGGKNATECSVNAAGAGNETCNGKDDDCNGTTDNGFECRLGSADEACTTCDGAYSGLRSCSVTCAWQNCSRFAFPDVTIDDVWTPFNHACGFNCAGDVCAVESNTPSLCYLIDGGSPRAVPPGKYEVAWNLGDTGVFNFTVLNGANILASTPNVDSAALTSPNVIQTFVVTACAQIEFRLEAHAGARIRLNWITLKRTGEP